MLHVVVTSCPTPSSNSLQSSLELENPESRNPLCSSTSASSFLPASGAVLFFHYKIRPWQQCFSWRPCLGTFRGHWVGWGNYHCSSRCLVYWGSLSCLPLINYTWSPRLLSLNSYLKGNTYAAYIFLCCDIYMICTSTLYVKMYIFIYKSRDIL